MAEETLARGVHTELRDRVALITVSDPERRNAMAVDLSAQLVEQIQRAEADPGVGAVVVTGASPGFCAGANLDELGASKEAGLRRVYAGFMAVANCTLPTIAAVNGPAVGAGLNLAFACDLRIAGPGAALGATFSRIGLHPGGGCTYFLVRALGPQRALALLLDGATLTAEESLAAGLVLRIVPDPVAAALELAGRYADLDPSLVRDIKETVTLAIDHDLSTVVDFESWAQAASAKRPAVQAAVARFAR